MNYLGTSVIAGKATAIIVTIGMQTELGRIAGLLQLHEIQPAPLQRRLGELGQVFIWVCLVIVGVIFALQLARGGNVLAVSLVAVSLAVVVVPEGLPAVVTVALALGLQRMVLTDDNLASIVSDVEEGRGIVDNIQKFVACNAGEVLLMFVAALLGWPIRMIAIQILWINLVTDGLPALALAMEPPEADIMRRRPRPPYEPVITWATGTRILVHGALIAAAVLIGFWLTNTRTEDQLVRAKTVTFCVAAFSQLFFSLLP